MQTDVIEKMAGMNERELIAFAKTDKVSKAELGVLIDDMAAAQRERGESFEQSFTRLITEDRAGAALYKIFHEAPGRDHHQEAVVEKFLKHVNSGLGIDDNDGDEDTPHRQLTAMAQKLREANPKLTAEQAYTNAGTTTEKGRELFQQAKAAGIRKNFAAPVGASGAG